MAIKRNGGVFMYKLSVLLLTFSLTSCSWILDLFKAKPGPDDPIKVTNCVNEDFVQGQDNNLYGLDCIEDKQIVIKTAKSGPPIGKYSSISDINNLHIADDVDFMNKFYDLSYSIIEGGDNTDFPFLSKDFLPVDEPFIGNKDTEYRIIFKTVGNYLVLFKASKNLEDIPFIERSSMEKEEGFFMVPFIGYQIVYCNPEAREDLTGTEYEKAVIDCGDSHLQTGKYIQVQFKTKTAYDYKEDLKKDLFPSDYFKGEWYFSVGLTSTPGTPGEKSTAQANLIKIINPKNSHNNIAIVDNSGEDISDENKRTILNLPAQWVDLERSIGGNNQWRAFAEQETHKSNNKNESSYLKIGFMEIKELPTTLEDITGLQIERPVKTTNRRLEKMKIETDYFTFSYREVIDVNELIQEVKAELKSQQQSQQQLRLLLQLEEINGKEVERLVSFLRAESIDTANFVPRRWFFKDQVEERLFGVFDIAPERGNQLGDTKEDAWGHIRMRKIHAGLTEEQKKAERPKEPFKVIKWYFSKNSTDSEEYREIATTAVDIYDRAFRYISNGKIGVELIESEEKDLGDLRYNIINLVEKDSNLRSGLLGWGPSYTNPNTGQIIGATANIFITSEKQEWFDYVKMYVLYEVFQAHKKTEEENKIHVVSAYLRERIETKCESVTQLIANKQEEVKAGSLKPRNELGDKEKILGCMEKLMGPSLLTLILHEMGHNFGLMHNFSASADKENYYGYVEDEDRIDTKKAIEEIKKIFGSDLKFDKEKLARSSSVMDYVDTKNHPGMEYLGKYDLAALRYLYLDEIENKDGTVVSLNINPDSKKQKALSETELKTRKDYQNCLLSELQYNPRQTLFCKRWDYGSSPEDIFKNTFLKIKRHINHRYTYNYFLNSGYDSINLLQSLKVYYDRWKELKDSYLESTGQEHFYTLGADSVGENSIKTKYTALLEEGKEGNEEYALYYPIREKLANFLMELTDYEEMTCHVTDKDTGETHQLLLNDIVDRITDKNLYVEDCQDLEKVFQDEALIFNKQSGYENFSSYYPYHEIKNRQDVMPIKPLADTIHIFNPETKVLVDTIRLPFIPGSINWFEDPDLLQALHLKAQENILNPERNKGSFGQKINTAQLFSYYRGLKLTLSDTKAKELIKNEHLNDFGFRRYYMDSGHDRSFDKLVETPLADGKEIENPFLMAVHGDWKSPDMQLASSETNSDEIFSALDQQGNQQSFKDYLIEQKKDEIVITTDVENNNMKMLITAFKPDSFSAEVIKKYNETLKDISALEEKLKKDTKASLTTHLNKTALERYAQLLHNLIIVRSYN